MNVDARSSPLARVWPLAAAVLIALLAACGGGEGDAEPGAAAASPDPSASSLSGTGPSATATCNLPDFAAGVLARVNQFRAAGASCGSRGAFAPAPGLAWNLALTQAADAHSRDMAANNFFSHTGTSGTSPGQRLTQAGYNWSTYGENIAAGQTSVDEAVDGWMATEGHCATLMSAAFVDIGVACVPGSASTTYRSYWTMDLGRAR